MIPTLNQGSSMNKLLLVVLPLVAQMLRSCCAGSTPPTLNPVKEYTFQAVVDHFNYMPTKTPTFDLRYLVNEDNWDADDGCVFFYAGNEADILQFVNNTGFMFEASHDFHALVVFVEHRYYGTSDIPWDDTYQFLTVEQAMEDFNTITLHIREKWSMKKETPFIVFGGSYGGNLAMWLRLKNPNLWAGAIASSATPLKHILRETNNFNRIETEVYGNVSTKCPDLVRAGWKDLYSKIQTRQGRKQIKNALGLCTVPRDYMAEDIYYWISDALETMVQYGYPYPTNFYNPVPGYPFRVACQGMLAANDGLGSLRAAADVYYNHTGQAKECYDAYDSVLVGARRYLNRKGGRDRMRRQSSRFHKFYEWQSNTLRHANGEDARVARHLVQNWEAKLTNEDESWGYQTCTEVYQPMPTDGITDFEIPYQPNQTEYFQDCQDRFGVVPRPNWEEMHFMGSDVGAGSNIYLSNGQLDPWRSAGIQEKPKGAPDSIIVRIIEGGAHHLDLRASHPLDPPSVTAVRNEERKMMKQWIKEWRELHSTR